MAEGHCLVCLHPFPCACAYVRYPGELDSRDLATVSEGPDPYELERTIGPAWWQRLIARLRVMAGISQKLRCARCGKGGTYFTIDGIDSKIVCDRYPDCRP